MTLKPTKKNLLMVISKKIISKIMKTKVIFFLIIIKFPLMEMFISSLIIKAIPVDM